MRAFLTQRERYVSSKQGLLAWRKIEENGEKQTFISHYLIIRKGTYKLEAVFDLYLIDAFMIIETTQS